MNHIYAPWRTFYMEEKKTDCVFCDAIKNHDLDYENGVLFRDSECFIIMNKYPYVPGHFMIIPFVHTDNVENLDVDIWLKMSKHAQSGIKMLKEGFGAHGVNIGMNLGEAAGAGIAEHIHLHLVPRWRKDTNFITTIANTRVYSNDAKEIYKKLLNLAPIYFKE